MAMFDVGYALLAEQGWSQTRSAADGHASALRRQHLQGRWIIGETAGGVPDGRLRMETGLKSFDFRPIP